ncbi:YggT family protein [Clostridium neuense]|uniref:YggT family protein n=1 Tax=Clostridium neuense TaxID=1728934 RepID=A0ABW8TGL1_9CLOT
MFITLLIYLIRVLEWAVIIDCVLSFLPMDSLYDFKRIVGTITSPFLEPFRRLQERFMPNFMIDFSPFFVLIFFNIIERVIITLALR